MNAFEYQAALHRLGWSHEQAARYFGVAMTTSWRWAKGDSRVPGAVAAVVRTLLTAGRLPPEQFTLKRRA